MVFLSPFIRNKPVPELESLMRAAWRDKRPDWIAALAPVLVERRA